jgi:hypothetical protein
MRCAHVARIHKFDARAGGGAALTTHYRSVLAATRCIPL